MNDARSGGLHRLWKDRFVRRVKPQPGEAVLDMAGGTGDVAFRLAACGAEVTVADINQEMLDVGIERALERGIDGLVWSRQNAEELSYPSRMFDAYTIAFGIRNVTHIDRALAEAHRVLRYGGRFFCLEFSTTEWPGFKQAYDRAAARAGNRGRRGQLPLPGRIDPPLSGDARIRGDDPPRRLRAHQGRTDHGRAGGDPFGLEDIE